MCNTDPFLTIAGFKSRTFHRDISNELTPILFRSPPQKKRAQNNSNLSEILPAKSGRYYHSVLGCHFVCARILNVVLPRACGPLCERYMRGEWVELGCQSAHLVGVGLYLCQEAGRNGRRTIGYIVAGARKGTNLIRGRDAW